MLASDVKMFCANPGDGNSMDPNKVCRTLGGDGEHCIPGCYPAGQTCADVHRDWLCSFPPSHIREALEAHARRGGVKNNEFVVDTRSVVMGLPNAVEAFFFIRNGPSGEREHVEGARQAFVREFRLPEGQQPPLLQLDLHGGGLAPFSVP